MYTKNNHILEYPNYKDINDFRESLIYGREIIINWNDIEYVIEYKKINEYYLVVSISLVVLLLIVAKSMRKKHKITKVKL